MTTRLWAVLGRAPLWVRLSTAGAIAVAIVALLVVSATRGHTPSTAMSASPSVVSLSPSPGPVMVPFVSPAELAALPEATTATDLAAASPDANRYSVTDGTVVHNPRPVPVFRGVGGAPIARLPVQQLGSDTWLPVVAEAPGWVRVLLPSRPNGSTGWLAAAGLQMAHDPFVVRAHLGSATVQLLRDGHALDTWSAATGAAATPTPTGRTFVLASVVDPHQSFSPLILPLGVHSSALDSYAGGPATVALHTWPTSDVYGQHISHGCLRVPAAAMQVLRTVPLGTLVIIDQS